MDHVPGQRYALVDRQLTPFGDGGARDVRTEPLGDLTDRVVEPVLVAQQQVAPIPLAVSRAEDRAGEQGRGPVVAEAGALCLDGGFHPATLRAVLATSPEVASALAEGRPDLPVQLLHGEDDPVVPVSVARAVVSALPSATLRVFAGDLHDVLNEHDRDVVHDELVGFVDGIAETGTALLGHRLVG